MSGAALVPASMALVAAGFPEGRRRDRAFGIYGAMAGLGFVAGMVASGVITEYLGWRWVFFVNVPVVASVLAMVPATIAESRDEATPRDLDPLGAVTATLGFAALVYTIGEVPATGPSAPFTIGMAVAGVVLLGGFGLRQHRARAPILPLRVFRDRGVIVPNAAAAILSLIGSGQLFVLTLYFQDVLGQTPLDAALLFLPMTVASVVASPLAGRFASRIGARPTAALGFALIAIGLLGVVASMAMDNGLAAVLAGTIVAEAGIMSASVALTIAALTGSGSGQCGLESGVLGTSREVGSATGFAAVAGIVSTSAAGSVPVTGDLLTGLRWGLVLLIASAALPLPLVLTGMPKHTMAGRASAMRVTAEIP